MRRLAFSCLPMSASTTFPFHENCFALLDDHEASAERPGSRLYTGHRRTLQCNDAAGLQAMLAQMTQALASGLHAVGVFSYELGAAMQDVAPRQDAPQPLAQLLLFAQCSRMSAPQVDAWLAARDEAGAAPAGIADVRSNVTDAAFHTAIDRIHDSIAAGEAYQVNHTYRLLFDAYGEPLALYRRLRARQPVPYGAFIAWPDGAAVLSMSPELLVQNIGGQLLARPMKGTAAASGDAAEDAARSTALAHDTKNRAENVMITDLLRNDLGRIAVTGSVQVPQLFEVQRHGQVLQMTSTIQATLRPGAGLAEVLAAVYPCGSITGAPKRSAMRIIRTLEPDARGVYTGAIGWFDATLPAQQVGDFCLSVPIRTLALDAPSAHGIRRGRMGVGAGIVHDSCAEDELEECRLKARFLTGLQHDFELFETMFATREGGVRHAALHFARLRASASYFGLAFDEEAAMRALEAHCTTLPPARPHRLRMALGSHGIGLQSAALQSIASTVKVLLAGDPIDAADLFLRHKTSVRQRYDAAWRAAEGQGAFDMLFFNTTGELTEGGRSNVFVQLGGRWYTPPLASGLLPGVMRAVLLADPALAATERTLSREDLRQAEALMVCNALRGAVPAELPD